MIWYILIGLIVAFFALPVTLAIIVYGTFACIISGLIIFRYRARTRPTITNEEELRSTALYLDEESATLQSLKKNQDECRIEKVRIYQQGDRLSLNRRGQDGRFDARGQGRLLNAKLAKLDKQFETLEDERFLLEMRARDRRQKQVAEYNEWQSKRALRDAFQVAFIMYCASALFLVTVSPLWSQQLSEFVARHIWPYLTAFGGFYGSLVAASCLAIATALICRFFYQSVSIKFHSGWEYETSKENIAEFSEPEELTEQEDSDEEHTGGENEINDEEQSPYAILGVSPSASRDEILAAYRELVKQYHPDFQQNRGPKLKELAEHETQYLNWAKEEALKRL